jgi:hypothetical protein
MACGEAIVLSSFEMLVQSLGRVARGTGADVQKARTAANLARELVKLNRPDRWCVLRVVLRLFENQPPIFWGVFLEWYSDSEANSAHGLKTRLQRVHRRQPAYAFLDQENRRAFNALPEWIEIYRGQQFNAPIGFSWTTNREKGEWFARRFAILHNRPVLLMGKVRKPNVLAVDVCGGEDEMLCHPRLVANLRQERLKPRPSPV